MRVSSPVGDLPFKARRLRWRGGCVVIEGEMGAWPAKISVSPADVPDLVVLLRYPLLALAMLLLVLVLLLA
jgi:hypothetical protein